MQRRQAAATTILARLILLANARNNLLPCNGFRNTYQGRIYPSAFILPVSEKPRSCTYPVCNLPTRYKPPFRRQRGLRFDDYSLHKEIFLAHFGILMIRACGYTRKGEKEENRRWMLCYVLTACVAAMINFTAIFTFFSWTTRREDTCCCQPCGMEETPILRAVV